MNGHNLLLRVIWISFMSGITSLNRLLPCCHLRWVEVDILSQLPSAPCSHLPPLWPESPVSQWLAAASNAEVIEPWRVTVSNRSIDQTDWRQTRCGSMVETTDLQLVGGLCRRCHRRLHSRCPNQLFCGPSVCVPPIPISAEVCFTIV